MPMDANLRQLEANTSQLEVNLRELEANLSQLEANLSQFETSLEATLEFWGQNRIKPTRVIQFLDHTRRFLYDSGG